MNRGMSEEAVKRRRQTVETAETAEAAESVFAEEAAGLLSFDGIEVSRSARCPRESWRS